MYGLACCEFYCYHILQSTYLSQDEHDTKPHEYRNENIVGLEKPLTIVEDRTKLETMMPTLTFMSTWHDKSDYYIVPGECLIVYMIKTFV